MVTTLEQEKQVMTGKIEDKEFRSMRENLIFYGLPEAAGIAMGPENCEEKVKAFISDQLKEEAHNIVFDRVHRLGAASKSKQPRPIVAKCHYYHDREKIRTAANANREDLKQTNHGVGVQLPKEWREARKSLYPIMQREKASGKNVRFHGDKLYVNGQPYSMPPTSIT